jgi:hypothetical protein
MRQKVSAFVVIIKDAFISSRQRRASYLLIESYKDRILSLEIEVEYHKQEKDRYEKLLFNHLGLTSGEPVNNNTEQVMKRGSMSPLRIKVQLEQASKQAMRHSKHE